MRKASPKLVKLLANCSPGVRMLTLAARKLVLTEVPEAEEVLYSVYAKVIVFKISGRKRGAFCNVAAYSHHMNLVFYCGARLPDPQRVLRGSGKTMRHIRIESLEDLHCGYLRDYIRSAIELVGPTIEFRL